MNEMMLPIIESPKYRVKLPFTERSVEYRPFTVKEEKILLIAAEAKVQKQILIAIRDVIESCSMGKIRAGKLAMVDFEALFLSIRSKSVGESIELEVECEHCKNKQSHTLNFMDVIANVIKPPKVANTFKVTDTVGVTLKYITVDDLIDAIDENDNIESNTLLDSLISASIETVFDEENVYKIENFSKDKVTAFVESLPHSALINIKDFMESVPTLSHTLDFTCSKCEKVNKIETGGMLSFF